MEGILSLPKIETGPSSGISPDGVVLAWFLEETKAKNSAAKGRDNFRPPRFLGRASPEISTLQERLNSSRHFTGKRNETSLLRYYRFGDRENVLLVGLGADSTKDPETARQAGAAVYLAQRREKLPTLGLQLDSLFASGAEPAQEPVLQAFCEGYFLASYDFREWKNQDDAPFTPKGLVLEGRAASRRSVEKAATLAKAVNLARVLGDRPGNAATPSALAREATELARRHGLRVEILGRKEIEKEKMGLLLGVARGSEEEPKLIVLEHRGGKKGSAPVVLVGKGVTFDSGGISLKPPSQMEDMKYDMMGAASVLGILQGVAAMGLPINVVGIIPATENLPGGAAQKPGDIARSLSGKTVEIVNTDAEGRLILADALEYAQKHFKPQAILDFATLTGAVVVALGPLASGIMGTSPELIQRIKDASTRTGERVWELPLFEEYEEDLKSHYADIKNSGSRDAGSSKGGIFLKRFVDTAKYPWVHFDIAGTSYHRKDVNYHSSKFASGAIVRLVIDLLEEWKPLH